MSGEDQLVFDIIIKDGCIAKNHLLCCPTLLYNHLALQSKKTDSSIKKQNEMDQVLLLTIYIECNIKLTISAEK